MKKFLLIGLSISLLLVVALLSNKNEPSPTLNIIYPLPDNVITINGKSVFLLGQITGKNATLSVNNVNASIDGDGAFLVYTQPIISEDNKFAVFNFKYKVDGKEYSEERKFPVSFNYQREFKGLEIDTCWSIQPDVNISKKEGELINLEIRTLPNAKVSASISGIKQTIPLSETYEVIKYIVGDAIFGDGFSGLNDTIKGIYRGAFYLPDGLSNASVVFTVEKDGKVISRESPGKISTLNNLIPTVVKTNLENNRIVGRHGPGQGYFLFLEEDIPLEIIGKSGNWYQAKLSKSKSVWLSASNVVEFPSGLSPKSAIVNVIRADDTDSSAIISLGLDSRVPYEIIQPRKNVLQLILYNTNSSIDWIRFGKREGFIENVSWQQPEDDMVKITVKLNQKSHWGYSTYYDNNTLYVIINKPPKRNSKFLLWSNQLKNRKIVIDPGHTPDYGAVGPRGYKEKDFNLSISRKLKAKLERYGANVFLTHDGEGITLRERKARVNSFHPEISISIHNNAVPQGVNPIVHNGTSVYYYFQQAAPLARIVQNTLLNELELPDFGLYWDNLYMCRIPESIAILCEPAFMSVPEQERLLSTEEFQQKIVNALFKALDKFYEEYAE